MASCGPSGPAEDQAALDPARVLSREPQPGFERITGSRPLVFPEDHGPHPQTQTEWWYVTGNVQTPDGRPFGFQFTVFRLGVVPPDSVMPNGSNWTTGELYMGHAALTDADGVGFVGEQRFTRPTLDLAGAWADPFRVWMEDWELRSDAGPGFFPLSLVASIQDDEHSARLDLRLAEGKPIVLHGDQGYSRKGRDAGDASMYFSFTRMPVSGHVQVEGDTLPVKGLAWMDREWSTSVLSRNQRGWDWFALQLDDDRELMFFELRSDVAADRVREATLVRADGSSERLDPSSLRLEPTRWWLSPTAASDSPSARTPVEWRLSIPDLGLEGVRIRALIDDQEHTRPFRYWEGAVVLERDTGEALGRGYAELTGYGTEPDP